MYHIHLLVEVKHKHTENAHTPIFCELYIHLENAEIF